MHGESEIKLCPFCGGTAAVVRGWKYDSSRAMFKVYCKCCQVRQPFHKTKIGAISDWNHRAMLVVKNGSSHNSEYMKRGFKPRGASVLPNGMR